MRFSLLTCHLVTFLAIAVATECVQAATIIYTISGTGSGTLGQVGFTNQPFSIAITANTDNVQPTGGGRFAVNNNSIALQLGASTYPGTSAGSSYIAIPSITTIPPVFAYSMLNVGGEIDTFNFAVGSFGFSGYDLQTSLGPLVAEAFTASTGSFFGFQTSAGFFTLASQISSAEMTFQATVQAVPEPSTFMLAAILTASAIAMISQYRLRKRVGKL